MSDSSAATPTAVTTKPARRGAHKKRIDRIVPLACRSGQTRLNVSLPRSRGELALFLRKHFGLAIPDQPLCPHHQSPMDYLASSFLEQRDLLVWANRGGGKTYLAAVATLLDAFCRPDTRISVLGGSFDQSDRLADYIRQLLDYHPKMIQGRLTQQRVRLATGSQIDILAQSQKAVRGLHVQKIRCDEVDLFDSDVWRAVQFATRSKDRARGSIEVLSTLHRSGGLMNQLVDDTRRQGATPIASCASTQWPGTQPLATPSGYKLIQWCLWDVIERCPPERPCNLCPLYDDCQGIAKKGSGFYRIDDAIAIHARSSRVAWEAEMLCRRARRDWLVLGEFDPARHVRPIAYCPDWPLYRAIDFGYRSPLVCLWIQLSPAGFVHVIQEYFCTRLAVDHHAVAIKNLDPGPVTATYVDPAGRQKESTSGASCTELLAKEGIPCTCRGSAIGQGLELIRSALAPASGTPTLMIHPRCTYLIDSLENYHYPPPESNADADKPVKDGPDHSIDALRYFFINRLWPGGEIRSRRY